MLNEGLHIDGVEAVILLRKTSSPNIHYQQIGRCLASGNTDSPIIFDLVNNFTNIRSSNLKNDLIEAIRQHNTEREKNRGLRQIVSI